MDFLGFTMAPDQGNGEGNMDKISAPWWWFFILLLGTANVLLFSGCGLISRPNLAQQLQNPVTMPPIVVSDSSVVQIAAELAKNWSGRNDLTELFSYGAEVSILALGVATVASGGSPGLAIGQAIWLGLLKIFQPDSRGLVYVEGMEDLTDGLTGYVLCMANDGKVVVPSNMFTPCGAQLFVTVGAATNNVNRGIWGLRPRRTDLERVQPLPIEGRPQGLQLPKSAVRVPQATVP